MTKDDLQSLLRLTAMAAEGKLRHFERLHALTAEFEAWEPEEAERERDEAREDLRTLFAACVSEFEYGQGLPEWLQEIRGRHPWMKEW